MADSPAPADGAPIPTPEDMVEYRRLLQVCRDKIAADEDVTAADRDLVAFMQKTGIGERGPQDVFEEG